MKSIIQMGILETRDLIASGQATAEEVTRLYLAQIDKYQDKNAILEVFDDALDNARIIDEKIKNGDKLGALAGVPFIIKDNMLYKGHKATCASKFLEHFVSPYTATAVQRLLDNDAVILGRANMDEFAMGGSNENSAFGACKNAYDDTRVSGGSSGGSAVAVALNMCAGALGTDTGGSVRQPSSFNGVVGMKPTYGRISRYGVVAFASSLDQVGPITKNVADNAYLLGILAGEDAHDQTSLRVAVDDYLGAMQSSVAGLKIGVCQQMMAQYETSEYYANFQRVIDFFRANGAEIVDIDIPKIELALPVYYILAPAEAASNLGRYDGVKYTTRAGDATDINQLYVDSRTQGFGDEVKRRIMLGNYVLSSGYFDAYYTKARKVRQYISNSFDDAFTKCDVIISPCTYGEAFKLGQKNDPLSMYLEDMFTVTANIAGIPAISVPYSHGANGLPLGLQILSKHLGESAIYTVADYVEKNYKEVCHE